MKKATKKSQILSMLAKGMKPNDVAKKLGVGIQSVYSAKYVAKKSAPHKLFKQRSLKKITAPVVNDVTPSITISATNNLTPDAVGRITARVQLEDKVEALQIEIANLKHQIIGFRAVISYLEDLAGVRNSQ